MPRPPKTLFDGKKCACGGLAAHQVAEVISPGVSHIARAPLSAFLCHDHFCQLMAHSMYEALADGSDPSHQSPPPTVSIPASAPRIPSNHGEALRQKDHAGGPAPLLVSIKDARTLLGLGHGTIYKLIASDDLGVVKVGGRTLLEMATLRDFISKRRVAPGS